MNPEAREVGETRRVVEQARQPVEGSCVVGALNLAFRRFGGWCCVGEREHHADERDSVGDRVVDASEDDRTSVVSVDQVHVPQRLGRVERCAHQLADELAQCFLSAGWRERDVAHMVVDVELRIVLPVQHAAAHAGPRHALVEATEWSEAFVEQRAQPLDVDLAVERQDSRHHHQVGRVFHPQPRGVNARHRDQPGHRAVILRGIDGDFRRLHRDPGVRAWLEVQVAHR